MVEVIEQIGGIKFADLRLYAIVLFTCCIFIVVSSFVDMWSGIDAARVNKEKIDSKGLRRTVAKVVDYFRVLIFGTMGRCLGTVHFLVCSSLLHDFDNVGIICIEGRSVLENSRKKKSHAADVADMAQKIVKCISSKDAEDLIEQIKTKVERK
ncbi:phage holin family protein [Phocaeicola coprocola]|uniref:phage holin family protein n=1 Tax=Phocaeicola coprocola TaxID=310298 RepID=UPI00241CE49C|nr:phage holin family protein [Phocaeicola coprocola]